MTWPTPQDYAEAVQNPKLSFTDPELRGSRPDLTPLGLPRPITGNFASVYRMSGSGKPFAVRCFFRDVSDLRQRYDAISAHLSSARLPYTVGFSYLAQGISVRRSPYPLLKMEWAEGMLLDEYIRQCLGDSKKLAALAGAWQKMASDLRAGGIAHGDLQHGNVLCLNGSLRLVDYDGLFVPSLRGRQSHELGHPNFQHPERSERDFGPNLDHFSQWVIYASILALSATPELWNELGAGDERLLFGRADFLAPGTSPAFKTLAAHADNTVRSAALQLRRCLDLKPDQAPALGASSLPASRRRRPKPTGVSASPQPAALPDWVSNQLPATVPLSFRDPGLAPRVWLAVTAALLTLDLLPSTSALVSGSVRLEAASAVAASWLLTVGVSYLRDPNAITRLRVSRLRVIQVARLRSETTALNRLLARQKGLDRWSADFASRLAQGLQRTESRRARQVEAVKNQMRAGLDPLSALLADVKAQEAAALASALDQLRAREDRSALRAHKVRSDSIPAVGWTAKAQLWFSGIRSAADIEGHAPVLDRLTSRQAAAVLAWRESVRPPRACLLPDTERDRISSRYARRIERLERRRRRCLLDAAPLLTALKAAAGSDRTAFREREAALRDETEQRRRTLLVQIEAASLRLTELNRRLDRLDEAAETYRRLTVPRFVALLLFGRRSGMFTII